MDTIIDIVVENIMSNFRLIDYKPILTTYFKEEQDRLLKKGIHVKLNLYPSLEINASASVSENSLSSLFGHPKQFTVHVSEGMLCYLKSIDELKFVVGHEIAHIENRHHSFSIQHNLAEKGWIYPTLIMGCQWKWIKLYRVCLTGAWMVGGMFKNRYRHHQIEYDADLTSVRRSPSHLHGALSFGKRSSHLNDEQKKITRQSLFFDHPFWDERIENILKNK